MSKRTQAIVAAFAAVIATVVMLTGCGTASPSTIQHIATFSRITAKDSAYLVLKNNPQLRPQFVLARDELTVLGTATNLDFSLAISIVSKFPIKEIHNPVAEMVIQDAQLILTDLNLSYPLDKVENLRPIVVGLRDGVDDGLKLAQ